MHETNEKSPLQRDLAAQECALRGDMDGLREALTNGGPLRRPLSRALGYACRYGSPEMVALLLDHGATFRYNRNSMTIPNNGVIRGGWRGDALEQYLYVLRNPEHMPKMRTKLNRLDRGRKKRQDDKAYDEIVRLLVEKGAAISFDPSAFLYFATLYGSSDAVRALEKVGVTHLDGRVQQIIADEQVGRLTGADKAYPSELLSVLGLMENPEPWLMRLCEITGGPLRMREMPDGWDEMEQIPEERLGLLLRYTTLGRHYGRKAVLRLCVERGFDAVLRWALDEGWAGGWRVYEDLRAYADEIGARPDVSALLLEKQTSSGCRPAKPPSLNPMTASSLRKVWTVHVLEDETLEITAFKGNLDAENTAAVIPARIGRRTVSSVHKDTFRAGMASTGSAAAACRNLTEVAIPGTIRVIPASFLANHANVQRVVIGQGVEEICQNAFSDCPALYDVEMPEKMPLIRPGAFCRSPWCPPQPGRFYT